MLVLLSSHVLGVEGAVWDLAGAKTACSSGTNAVVMVETSLKLSGTEEFDGYGCTLDGQTYDSTLTYYNSPRYIIEMEANAKLNARNLTLANGNGGVSVVWVFIGRMFVYSLDTTLMFGVIAIHRTGK